MTFMNLLFYFTAETTEWLLKGKVIRQISHKPSAVSSSSTHASLHKNAFSSKEIEVVKKKINHQMPVSIPMT